LSATLSEFDTRHALGKLQTAFPFSLQYQICQQLPEKSMPCRQALSKL